MMKLFQTKCWHDEVRQMLMDGHTDLRTDGNRTGLTETYAQTVSADCDLDLCPSDIVIAHDT